VDSASSSISSIRDEMMPMGLFSSRASPADSVPSAASFSARRAACSRAGPGVVPDAAKHLDAVDLGELQVEQHDLGEEVGVGEIVEGLDPVAHDDDVVPHIGPAQRAEGERLVVGVVLRDEDHPAANRHVCPFDLSSECEVERRALADGTVRPDTTAVAKDDSLHGGQTDTGTGDSFAPCRRWNAPNSLSAYAMSKPTPLSRTK
jgi:hypothetical protein